MEAGASFEGNPDIIQVTASKEEWISILNKTMWIPDAALRDGDAWSKLVHWLINQGVYE